MDRLLAPNTQEAIAYHHLSENMFSWDSEHPSANELLVARFASYQAFSRYLNGSDLYLLPRSRTELQGVLRRYAHDAIHNTISRARSELSRGGYSRMCQMAESIIENVLDMNDNAAYLLSMHQPPRDGANSTELDVAHAPGARFVRIK